MFIPPGSHSRCSSGQGARQHRVVQGSQAIAIHGIDAEGGVGGGGGGGGPIPPSPPQRQQQGHDPCIPSPGSIGKGTAPPPIPCPQCHTP